MPLPENYILIATARLQDGRYTCVSLCALPRESLEDLLSAFEKSAPAAPWDEDTAFSAFVAGLEIQQVAQGAVISGFPVKVKTDDLLTERPTVGPALWFLRHKNQGQFAWPLEIGIIIGIDLEKDVVMFEPISNDFLDEFLPEARRPTLH